MVYVCVGRGKGREKRSLDLNLIWHSLPKVGNTKGNLLERKQQVLNRDNERN